MSVTKLIFQAAFAHDALRGGWVRSRTLVRDSHSGSSYGARGEGSKPSAPSVVARRPDSGSSEKRIERQWTRKRCFCGGQPGDRERGMDSCGLYALRLLRTLSGAVCSLLRRWHGLAREHPMLPSCHLRIYVRQLDALASQADVSLGHVFRRPWLQGLRPPGKNHREPAPT